MNLTEGHPFEYILTPYIWMGGKNMYILEYKRIDMLQLSRDKHVPSRSDRWLYRRLSKMRALHYRSLLINMDIEAVIKK